MSNIGWVLILFASGTGTGGPALQEFSSKTTCEYALTAAQVMAPSLTTVRGVCVPK
jgi:hypothetical protein